MTTCMFLISNQKDQPTQMDAHHVHDRRDLSFHRGRGHHGLNPHHVHGHHDLSFRHDRDHHDHRDQKYSLL